MSTAHAQLMITTSRNHARHAQIWDTTRPFGLGSPLRWVFEKTKKGIRVRDLKNATVQIYSTEELDTEKHLEFKLEQAEVTIRPVIKLNPSKSLALSSSALTITPASFYPDEAENKLIKKSLQGSGIGLSILMLLILFWPKAKEPEQELIPPQYAKIVMVKPKAQAPAPAGTQGAGGGTPTKAKNTELAQAVRSAALKNAVKGLLKGNMTKLLAHSQLTAGMGVTNKMFAAGVQNNTSVSQMVGQSKVDVAMLGGSGTGGGGGGSGVGYGKGEKAGVQGQGNAFVDLDTFGADVEEGLTKDEIGRVIHAHMNEIRYCYESAMVHTPQLEGKLLVDFTIGSNGAVKTTAVKQSTIPDPRLDDCILRRLVKWPFPKPKGGVEVAVSYPFIFKSLGI